MTGIKNRLEDICDAENREVDREVIRYDAFALEYLAKIADGGMRDAITLLDKCLAYSKELTVNNVVSALGTVDYDIMVELTDALYGRNLGEIIGCVEKVYAVGKDLKQFVKDYTGFLLDINKFDITHSFEFLQLPNTYLAVLQSKDSEWYNMCRELLPVIVSLNAEIKWDTQPKVAIEAKLLTECVK